MKNCLRICKIWRLINGSANWLLGLGIVLALSHSGPTPRGRGATAAPIEWAAEIKNNSKSSLLIFQMVKTELRPKRREKSYGRIQCKMPDIEEEVASGFGALVAWRKVDGKIASFIFAIIINNKLRLGKNSAFSIYPLLRSHCIELVCR